MTTEMKIGKIRKKLQPLIFQSDKVQQSFIVDQSGKFQHGQMVIDQSGLKNEDDPDGVLMSLNYADLELLDVLGRGASSYVQRARHRKTGQLMALKVIDVFDKDKRHQLMKEIQTLRQADCPNLVTFYGAFYRDAQISIGLELMDAGSLEDILRRVGKFPEAALAIITVQILQAFFYLHHTRRSMHRDIKPSNICVNRNGVAKLTDFGVATEMKSREQAQTFVGTFVYMSPERISGGNYQFNSDIWSFGLCLMECAIGRFPYPPSLGYMDTVQTIVNDPPPALPEADNFSEHFGSFLQTCLRKNPAERPDALELMRHPWLSDPAHADFDMVEWIAAGINVNTRTTAAASAYN